MAPITDYQALFQPALDHDGRSLFILRVFVQRGESRFLVVDATSLATRIVGPDALTLRRPAAAGTARHYVTAAEFAATPYARAVLDYGPPAAGPANAGLRHAADDAMADGATGMALSIDLCPSTRPLELEFFTTLTALARSEGRALPVAIAVTGMWMLQHDAEWQWLLQQQRSGVLDITWVNHSFSHLYLRDEPFEENFLAHAWSRLQPEILLTERMLLEQGVVPSIFFRAPGLITNDFILSVLREHGLVPLGADAWLAKGQRPTPGSIVLVHGNGNEPEGIVLGQELLADPARLPLMSVATAIVGAGPATVDVASD